ncbi:hypothetical protein PVL30_004261 [Lodderomyces elongisporus]|uniref:uncharacterized protein n=1 Tax=Lodderomyces elongisporus TaxID=36914 RepID=UPI0029241237|nr:uncharacterized protein PVL30_004261 [Lodderomyces elongisporus]WLF80479.1 hypothetical protein PVL30_004261 [Lodderomyces elongisporus]
MNSTLASTVQNALNKPFDPTLVTVVAFIFASFYLYTKSKVSSIGKNANKTISEAKPAKSSFYNKHNSTQLQITPLTEFKWNEDNEPLKSMPFKNAPYKLTMGIRSLEAQDWLLIEPTYLSRLEHKRRILNNCHPAYPKTRDLRSSTLFASEEAREAVVEFYDIVMDYCLRKYPTCFATTTDSESEYHNQTLIHNLITNKKYPLKGNGIEPKVLEEYLSQNIEEDFIILLKDPLRAHEEYGEEYWFKAGVFGFAAGFDPKERFNKPLTSIHQLIPGYTTKLKTSMNRFFDRLSPGQFVTRSNWSMQTHKNFYVDDQNKGHNLPNGHEQKAIPYESLNFDDVRYRSERQVLTKLPKSGAVVFTIRTYLIPIEEIRNEGPEVCERLIGAIKGFPDDIKQYKAAGEWGPAIIQYLSKKLD